MASEIERAIIELQVLYRGMHQRLAALERGQGAPAAQGVPPQGQAPAADPPAKPPEVPPQPPPQAQETSPQQPPPPAPRIPVPQSPTPLRAAQIPPAARDYSLPEFTLSDYNARVQAVLKRIADRKKNVDASIENMIGQSVLSFGGGLVIFGGILLFLRFSFLQPWLQPANRVFDALLLGVGLLAAGQWLHHARMRPLAAAITAIGLVSLIAALLAANVAYTPPVLRQDSAFAGLVLVCAVGIGLALQLRMQLLAILALVGMYITPLVLSPENFDPLFLLGYLSLVTLAGLALCYFRRDWRWLRAVAFMALAVPLYFHGFVIPYAWILLSLALALYTLLTGSKVARAAAFTLLTILAFWILVVSSADAMFLATPVIDLPNLAVTRWMLLAGGAAVYALVLGWLLSRAPLAGEKPRESPFAVLLGCAIVGSFIWYPLALSWLDPLQLSTFASLLWILALLALGSLTFTAEDAGPFETIAAALLVITAVKWITIDALLNAAGDATVSALPGTRIQSPPFANLFVFSGLLIILAFRATRTLRLLGAAFFGWLVTLLAFVALNVELVRTIDQIIAVSSVRPPDPWLIKNIYMSIFSALFAMGISIVGFARKYPTARWVALVLFAATVVKVLVIDMARVDNSLRILSFMVVGTLLLIVSFLYHKTDRPPSAQAA